MKTYIHIMTMVIAFLVSMADGVALAQDKMEFGLYGGVSYYMGELNPMQQFRMPGPAIGGIARYNFTDRLAAKATVTAMNVRGEYPWSGDVYVGSEGIWTTKMNGDLDNTVVHYDEDGNEAPRFETYQDREYKFDKTVVEAAVMGEFNFRSFDHIFKKDDSKWTPYLTVGAGLAVYESYDDDNNAETVFVLSLPFGFGAKCKVNEWLRLGIEWRFSKLFADDLDYSGYVDGKINPKDPYGFGHESTINNNDWTSTLGVSVTLSMWPRKLSCNDGTRSFNR